jgi:hypothetical protein
MDFVIDAIKLEKLLRAAACDCWWEDGDTRGYGITFSRLLQLINESQRKSEENWKTESDDWIQVALMRLGIIKPDIQPNSNFKQKGIVGYIEGFIFHCPKCQKGFECAIFFDFNQTKASCLVCQSEMFVRQSFDESRFAVPFDTTMEHSAILASIEKKRLPWKLNPKLAQNVEWQIESGNSAIKLWDWQIDMLKKKPGFEEFLPKVEAIISNGKRILDKLTTCMSVNDALALNDAFKALLDEFQRLCKRIEIKARELGE